MSNRTLPHEHSAAALTGSTAVRVVGLWRGREVDVVADLSLEDDVLVVNAAPPIRVRLDQLDGYQIVGQQVLLYVHSGDVLDMELRTDGARAVMRASLDRAVRMPELTRSLREIGMVRGGDAAAHDRWFAPLLGVRRAMEGVTDPLRQLALLDVDRLGAELARTLLELSALRAGGDPPGTRALEAALEEETVAVRQALGRVALAATTLEGSASDSRLADWRRWVAAVRDLFRHADEAWPNIAEVLRKGP